MGTEIIECVKCDACGKLLPKETSDYYTIENLKLVSHVRHKAWDDNSYWNRTLVEYSGGLKRLFCSIGCVNSYIAKLDKD